MNKCNVCQSEITELPMCFGSRSPALSLVPEEEYESRVEESDDLCIVDNEHFFVRGHIELPLLDGSDVFIWSVWISLSQQSFADMVDNWDAEGRENTAPYFGWLMTSLPCYPETLHLKTSVQTQPVGRVPLITIEPSTHTLSEEQHNGILLERVHEIVHQVMQH